MNELRRDKIEIETDVLIIGGGIGGARAALRAKELGASVVLMEKAVISRAGPMTYVHSQYAPRAPLEGDELQECIEEFVVGANYLADQDWVEQYIRESYHRIHEQIEWGVPYSREKNGDLKYVNVRGHKIGTTLGVDGRVCMEILRRRIRSARIHLIEKVAMIELLTSDGQYPTKGAVCGAVGVHVRTGQATVVHAKSVILNTGPWYPKIHYAFADHCTGEGHMAAWRVGAVFAGMEFAHFAAWSYFNKQFFTPGQAKIQGIGAHFINASGERFMKRYDPVWEERSGLFQVARAIMTENLEGRGPCHLDLRHVPQADLDVLYEVSPTVKRAFDEFGIDPTTELLELGPFVVLGTGSSSGPDIDLNGATNIAGLYAVGYGTSCPHLMSGISGSGISSFSAVAGYRAGEHAANRALEVASPQTQTAQVEKCLDDYFEPLKRLRQTRASDVWMEIGRITTRPDFALFKTAGRIKQAQKDLEKLRDSVMPKAFAPDMHELEKVHEVAGYLDLAILTCRAMLERTESRGELFRVDYPNQDNDKWLKWILMRRQEGKDEPEIRFRELDYDSWPVQPVRGQKASPYTVPPAFADDSATNLTQSGDPS